MSTSALPVSSDVPEVAITLTRISASLLNGDLFLPDLLNVHIKGLRDKYDQNARNYLKNTGKSLWLEGFNSTDPAEDVVDRDTTFSSAYYSGASSGYASSTMSASPAASTDAKAGSFYDKAVSDSASSSTSDDSQPSSTSNDEEAQASSTAMPAQFVKRDGETSPSYGPPASFPPHRMLIPSLLITAQLPTETNNLLAGANLQSSISSSGSAMPSGSMVSGSMVPGSGSARSSGVSGMVSMSRMASASGSAMSALPSAGNRATTTAGDALTSHGGGTLWTGPISIGSNGQAFTIDFDTVSSTFFDTYREAISSIL